MEIGNLQNLVTFGIEKNQITGALPINIFNMSSLQTLLLSRNKLTGSLPRNIRNLTMLQHLELQENNLTGALPREIGQLHQLQMLQLGHNTFIGSIPPELFNISALANLSLADSGLSGRLPTNLCSASPRLEQLSLNQNNLSGEIPDKISNCSRLRILNLASNNFTGSVPLSLGELSFLERLYLFGNNLKSETSPSGLAIITSLTNCRYLNYFDVGSNPLGGTIPVSAGNFSSSLETFYAYDCKIVGTIPPEIGNLSSLVSLSLFYNHELSGDIPITFKHLSKLQGLFLDYNNMTGFIPEGLCGLESMNILYLSGNQFSGPIPECFGNVSSLRYLLLSSNVLNSSIPSSLWRLKDLLYLDLSLNALTGILPRAMGNIVAAFYVNLSINQLSGSIPTTIENLKDLGNLSLAHNNLEGSIPESLGNITNLVTLDLSYNNLSDSIPQSLEALRNLLHFNVSFNALRGAIPTGGPFRNFTVESFKSNEALCGSPRFEVPLCHNASNHKSKWKKAKVVLFVVVGVVVFITIAYLAFVFLRYRREDLKTSGVDGLPTPVPERISYYEILRATGQLSESNLLGSGSFGSVYKGVLRDGKGVVAVKVFNLHVEGAFRSFDVECGVLRNVRHKNLTKVISSCSNEDFKALVLEYMSNGSLDKWLYSQNVCFNVMQRLGVMIDVASALEYLHHGYTTPIAHCDLKPSNVLLDEEMIAHVSDFGISKLLGDEGSVVLTNTLATLGYMAPEYGSGGLVSTRCDVYSFGMMLMETFTGKRPSDDMFVGDLSLKRWVESLLPQSPGRVIDATLLVDCRESVQCVSSILGLALRCSTESPADRIDMKVAVNKLRKIKEQFEVLC